MRILAVDPGLRGCGCATFEDGSLQRATYVKNQHGQGRRIDNALAMATEVDAWADRNVPLFAEIEVLLVEVPRSYDAGQQKGPQNDLIDLALVCAAIAGKVGGDTEVVTYYPQEWKGSIKADTFTERILEALSNEEKQRIQRTGALDHNTIDAVGLGLKYLGRLERTRKYARD